MKNSTSNNFQNIKPYNYIREIENDYDEIMNLYQTKNENALIVEKVLDSFNRFMITFLDKNSAMAFFIDHKDEIYKFYQNKQKAEFISFLKGTLFGIFLISLSLIKL